MSKVLLILLVLGGLIAAVVMWQGKHYRSFADGAHKVKGVLVAKQEHIAEPKTKRKEHWAIYRYQDTQGTAHTGEERVEYDDLWHSFREGQEIDVYVDAKNPSQSHLGPVLDRRLDIANTLSSH